jgi:hypothetical protein
VIRSPTPAVERMRQYRRRRRQRAAVQEEYGSVAGKRNFQGRDKEAETASNVQGRRCRDKVSLNKPANSGLVSEN